MLAGLASIILLTVGFGTASADSLSPGDALGLDPVPVEATASGTTSGPTSGVRLPTGFAGASTVLIGGAAAVGLARRRRDDEPLVVVVHGNGGAPTDFDGLVGLMGIPDDRVVVFDWKSSGPGATSTDASRSAPTAVASRELEMLLRELSLEHGNIYTIHHSKGGAVGADLIGRLDMGVRPPIDGYRGAALLDPAIASGPLGFVQRIGRFAPFIPDNGGFEPFICDDDGCSDSLAGLGEASGVEVIAVRNPDAVLTNFNGKPQGLRVYDLVDDGKPSAYASWFLPPLAWKRVFEAHSSVLSSPIVAACIGAEIAQPKSCVWKGSWTPRIGWRGSGGGRPRAL